MRVPAPMVPIVRMTIGVIVLAVIVGALYGILSLLHLV
jgi:hypothetical protein